MAIEAGKYLAKADPTTAQWLKSSQKGTPAVEMTFVIEAKEPHAGERVRWTAYFTEKTQARNIEALQYAGCAFPSGKITDLTGLGSQVVQIVVEIEVDQRTGEPRGPRVAWVNDPNAGGKPLGGNDLDAFAADMALALDLAKANKARSGGGSAPAGASDEIGF